MLVAWVRCEVCICILLNLPRTHARPHICVEVGSGSGTLITALAMLLGHKSPAEETYSDDGSCTLASSRHLYRGQASDLVAGRGKVIHKDEVHGKSCGMAMADSGWQSSCVFLATDKNPDAAAATLQTLRFHGVTSGDCIRTSFLHQVRRLLSTTLKLHKNYD